MTGPLSAFSLRCPNCQHVQQLTVADIPPQTVVTCASCNAMLGRWRDLAPQAQASDAPPQEKTG